MIFEKPSTRTRLSFEAGMHQLGGAAIYLYTRDTQLGRGEAVEDAGQVISRMCDIVMIRTFEQDIIERFRREFARPGDQRSDQRIPSLPGASRTSTPTSSTAARSRQDGGVDRRFEQRVQHLAAGGDGVRLQPARVDPSGLDEVEPDARRSL